MLETYPNPQYLIVNKIPSGGIRGSKFFWDPKKIKSIKAEAIDEIRELVGTEGSPTRKLGFCFIIPYLEKNVDSVAVLQRMLEISFAKDMPILVKLDGLSWWETRPDLWNFWDPKLPGFNPNNRQNVEWTSWDSKDAIKISWRNWGRQFRVSPHPNLGSPQYIEEKRRELQKLIPIIVNWYQTLPEDKKYLLAGVVLDNELSIGLNHYYYPHGNNYLDQDSQNDPKQGFNFKKGPNAGFVQLGYASVKSYGIKNSGRLTLSDLNQAVQQHAQFLGQTALCCGLDPDKIFIHGMGNSKKRPDKTFSYSNMITPFSRPGWTIYDVADNPKKSTKLNETVGQLDGTYWGIVEWFLFKKKSGLTVTEQWKQALFNVLNYPNNKMVVIYNWEAISRRLGVIKAIRKVLNQAQPNWLSPAPVSVQISWWRKVQITWNKPTNANQISLQISTKPDLLVDGGLANIDVLDRDLNKLRQTAYFLKPGRYYWQIKVTSSSPLQKRFTRGSFEIPKFRTFLSQEIEKIKSRFTLIKSTNSRTYRS